MVIQGIEQYLNNEVLPITAKAIVGSKKDGAANIGARLPTLLLALGLLSRDECCPAMGFMEKSADKSNHDGEYYRVGYYP
jgi:hypothetical protein